MTIQANPYQGDTPYNPQSKVPASAWQKAFAIPELRSHVATFLGTNDVLRLTQTCRHWHQIWLAELFTVVVLHSPPSAHLLALLGTYGHHVRTLKLVFSDCGEHCAQILQLTPNTRSLDLFDAYLSKPQMKEIVLAAPACLQKLQFILRRVYTVLRDELFVFLVHLENLQSVYWASTDIDRVCMVRMDDILQVLEACPRLTSLNLGCVEVIDSEPVPTSLDISGMSVASFQSVHPDIDSSCVGHRLHDLKLNNSVVSDESLLKLLGVCPIDQVSSAAHSHPLVRLELNLLSGNTVTSRSVARILQECHVLEVLTLRNTNVVLAHIFRESQVWPCAQSLRDVCFDNKTKVHQGQMTSKDQELVRDHLCSLTKVESLRIVGYPLGFVAVEGVEFAHSLQVADLSLEVEAPWDYFQESADAQVLAQGNWWIKSQLPQQWVCGIERGPLVQYYFSYSRTHAPRSEAAVFLGSRTA